MKSSNFCKECYSENPRITPLNGARECLENHKQYICSKCGRIVCIDLGGERKARCFFPFKTKEIALLYLKCAEIITNSRCGIYELNKFLEKHKDIKCENKTPVYINEKFAKISPEQVRYLTKDEVEKYLLERKEFI